MSQWAELGRTRLYTLRERRRRLGALLLALGGAVLSAWIAAGLVSWVSGNGMVFPSLGFRPITSGGGGLLGLPHVGQPSPPPRRVQVPLTLSWPVSPIGTAVVAVPLWLVWLRFTIRPLIAGLRQDARHRGLAPRREIRRVLGARAVRRAGRFTLPDTPWWVRWGLPTSAFGYFLGYPLHPRGKGPRLWADWEQRIRVVARTGWGKTSRLLVPIIRALPGPALVSSTEPGIFTQTVTARRFRRVALRWPWLGMLLRCWLPLREYPLAVVDFSPPDQRYAAGYPRVRWSPIPGCVDFAVAHRRALSLVAGVDTDTGRGSDTDQFFRDCAAEVLAAWLHAAALGGKGIEDLLEWLGTAGDPVPGRILRDDARADPSALVNLRKHLDPAAAKTTSGVQRYLALSMNSLATVEGRELCSTGSGEDQFDTAAFISSGGTVYVLADPSRIERTRPLLSLFAAEMFLAAEQAALRTRRKRLPQPYIAVLDELRYGITVPNLPYVASAQRKFGIGYVYAVQSTTQEDAVYGKDAPALRAAAGVSLYGGIDIDSARELSERAGVTPVVTATRGVGTHTEHIQLQDTLTIGDQQQLADGQATVVVRGLAPFLAWVPSIYEQRSLHRRIRREAEAVAQQVAGARHRELATLRSRSAAAAVGADFGQDRG